MISTEDYSNGLQGVLEMLQMNQEITDMLIDMIKNGQITFVLEEEL